MPDALHPHSIPVQLRLSPEVRRSLDSGAAVVALESSVFAQGLPVPANRTAARRMEQAIRQAGAVPAVTAVIGGEVVVGLLPDEEERLLAREGVRKVAARDLPTCMAQGGDGATTVSAAITIAHLAGISVFATGGIGGVHRGAPFDESADLGALARTPMIVVSAGAKSILDLPATLERLETNGVTVVGFRTSDFPGFFAERSGLAVPARAESEREVAEVFRAGRALQLPGAVLVVQPPPAAHAIDPSLLEEEIAAAVTRAAREGVTGAALTPFLLGEVERGTGGRSLGANLALLEANAGLAGRVAVELTRLAQR